MAESNTAYNTLVLESVNKVHIEYTRDCRVEDGKPIRLDLLLVGGKALKIQFGESVTHAELGSSVIRNWVSNLW